MNLQTFNQIYLNVEQINKGGTGSIYRAYHRNLAKYVVLKDIELDDINLKRREVDILKNLRHRYLPTLYDFIEVEGRWYIVEDYIKGTDLEVYLKNRIRVSEEQLLEWLRQMCEVLEYLHSRKPNIIHSDIKPGNIMIDENGDICLIDFNISILQEQNAVVLGYSNFYCSPEQLAQASAIIAGYGASSVKVDNRSDIYSMAATFYAIISGVIPVTGMQNFPLCGMNLPYSEGLLRLLDKCMETSPSKRFQSAKQVAYMLKHTETLTKRYRKYALMRSIISVVGAVIMLMGILTLVYGDKKKVSTDYINDYREVSYNFELSGASYEVFCDVQDILNEDKYSYILKKNPMDKAILYAIEGEYNFSLDTLSGYARAMSSYQNALESGVDKNIDADMIKKFALNYITSAALAGCINEAEIAVIRYFGSENTVISYAVDAEIAYSNRDYESVFKYAEKVRNFDESGYDDIKASVYEVAALACEKAGDLNGVVLWYTETDKIRSTDESKRCLVSALINAAVSTTDDSTSRDLFARAETAYSAIINKIPEDNLNFAQILYSNRKYSESLEILEKTKVGDILLLCKRSYILSVVHYEINGKQNNAESKKYCHEAVNYYNELSRERKQKISRSQIESLMQILDIRLELK